MQFCSLWLTWTIVVCDITSYLNGECLAWLRGNTIKIDLDDVRFIGETAITIKGSRRRITVPADVVKIMGLKDGDRLRWVVHRDGLITLHKTKD